MAKASLHHRVIAITRPVLQAQRLSRLIHDAGGATLSFPLIDIAPLADYRECDAVIAQLSQMDWAIFISSNAVENAMPRILQKMRDAKLNGFSQTHLPKKLKFAAIGPVTAEALKKYGHAFGLDHVLLPALRFDSEALLSLPEMRAVNQQQIMIFRGIGGREVLADTLKARGATVVFAESYQRINPQSDCTTLDDAIAKKACDAIVVTSSEAMRHLLALAPPHQYAWLSTLPICVNHARIKDEAQAFALNVHVAEAPGDDAMLACVQRALM